MDTKLIVALNFVQSKTMSKMKKTLNGKMNETKNRRKNNSPGKKKLFTP